MPLKFVAALILAFAPACISRAGGTNLILNGGFETGSFSNWTTQPAGSGSNFGVSSFGYAGAHCAYFGASNGAPDHISQTFPTAAGVEFTVSFWVYNSGAGGDFLMVLWDGSVIFNNDIEPLPLNAWTYKSIKVLATAAMSELEIMAFDGPAYIYVDDVSVEPDNLVANPSFETNSFAGWSTQAAPMGSNLAVGASGATGSYSAAFAAVQYQHDQLWQNIPTVAGRVYMLRFSLINSYRINDSLRVYWEGKLIYDGTPVVSATTFVPLTFLVVSTGSSSELRFAGYDAPGAIGIDDIYVGPFHNAGCLHEGDADLSGDVNFADITAVLRNWNVSCAP